MRYLITGADGQLGRALRRLLDAAGVIACARASLDITDVRAVRAAVAEARPDVIINAAALTDTSLCEREPRLAHAVNALGAENVARGAAATGAKIVAISTNEVFAGDIDGAYLEDAYPHPLNEYATSKLEGERRVRAASPDALIIRTAWVYGDGDNFVEKVLRAARTGTTLRFVTDEVATPTNADDLAQGILGLLAANAPGGIYHLTNEGEASRFDWASEIVRLAGVDAGAVEPVTTDELRASGYHGPHKPPRTVLANTRANALGVRLRPWQDALAAYFARERVTADG